MNVISTGQLQFHLEWEHGAGVQSPELAATWARLEIWIDDDCVTQVEDVETRSARRSIYAALYPLAEWIAYNWWLLKANVRPAAFPSAAFGRLQSRQLRPWLRAHNVRAAGDGYVWPNLTILPEGPATRLVWHADRRPLDGAPIRYLATGEAWVDTFGVERAFADLVEAVMTRLDESRVEGVALQDEWAAVLATEPEEAEFCLAAARLGVDPYTIDASTERLVLEAGESLEAKLLRDFLEAVSPNAIPNGLRWLARGSAAIDEHVADPSTTIEALRSRFDAASSEDGLPWIRGWKAARTIRSHLELDETARFDTSGTFDVIRRASRDPHLQALGGRGASGGDALVLGRALKVQDTRFAQARALWHSLAPSAPERFLLTSSPAYQPRVGRAFAAELLAPAEGVSEVLATNGDGIVTTQDIEAAAAYFDVNPFIIRHQVENQLGLAITA